MTYRKLDCQNYAKQREALRFPDFSDPLIAVDGDPMVCLFLSRFQRFNTRFFCHNPVWSQWHHSLTFAFPPTVDSYSHLRHFLVLSEALFPHHSHLTHKSTHPSLPHHPRPRSCLRLCRLGRDTLSDRWPPDRLSRPASFSLAASRISKSPHLSFQQWPLSPFNNQSEMWRD